MKIGMVGNVPPPIGGAQVFTENLINRLIKYNYEVVLARWKKKTYQYRSHMRKYIYKYNSHVRINEKFKIYSIFKNPSRFQPKAWFDIIIQCIKLARAFSVENVDIIHCHLRHLPYPEACFAFIAAKILRKPLVVTMHGLADFAPLLSRNQYYKKLLFKLLIFILRRTNKIVVVSEEIKETCLQYKIKNVEKICCGIDVDYFRPTNSSKEKGILYIGKIDPNKGAHILLKAYGEIVDKIQDDLILVGRGLDELTKINKDMEFVDAENSLVWNGRVHFKGETNRKSILDLINKSKVVVLPSFSEGLPLAILEAMACGKVVVASRIGELKEIINEGKNGFLIDPGNIEQLSSILFKVIKDFDKYKTMGLEARKTAENFKIEKTVKAYIRLYNDLI